MVLFGKDIDITDGQMVGLIFGGVLLLGVVLGFVLIYPKVNIYNEKCAILLAKVDEKNKKIAERDKEQQTYNQLNQLYEKQKLNLEALIKKFNESSLRDETDLKVVIQQLLGKLGLNSIEISKSDIDSSHPDYMKVYIPYKLQGDFSKIGRLFYYLENSKWLLTFNGTDLKMQKVEDKDKRQVTEVSFKVGAYIIKPGSKFQRNIQ